MAPHVNSHTNPKEELGKPVSSFETSTAKIASKGMLVSGAITVAIGAAVLYAGHKYAHSPETSRINNKIYNSMKNMYSEAAELMREDKLLNKPINEKALERFEKGPMKPGEIKKAVRKAINLFGGILAVAGVTKLVVAKSTLDSAESAERTRNYLKLESELDKKYQEGVGRA